MVCKHCGRQLHPRRYDFCGLECQSAYYDSAADSSPRNSAPDSVPNHGVPTNAIDFLAKYNSTPRASGRRAWDNGDGGW